MSDMFILEFLWDLLMLGVGAALVVLALVWTVWLFKLPFRALSRWSRR